MNTSMKALHSSVSSIGVPPHMGRYLFPYLYISFQIVNSLLRVLRGGVMRCPGENKMSACVFALVSIILFMPVVGSGAGTYNTPEVEKKQVLFCLLAIDHATRAWDLGTEGLMVDATTQTRKAVKLVEQAIELLPSRSHVHSRQAAEHLRASKQHFQTALQHWEKGDLKQALGGVMLGRDYAEASILYVQCNDFVCR